MYLGDQESWRKEDRDRVSNRCRGWRLKNLKIKNQYIISLCINNMNEKNEEEEEENT